MSDPAIRYWWGFASIGPDGNALALTGSTVPFKRFDLGDLTRRPYVAEAASVLVILDLKTRQTKVFAGTFDNFGVPVWSASGDQIVVSAPFERRRLYLADVAGSELRPIDFKVMVPTLLIDAVAIDHP